MLNHTCIHRDTCYSYSHTNCDGCNNANTDYNKPEKKMILVGLSNRELGWEFFKAVLDSLERYSVNVTHTDCVRLRFETEHTKTWFFFKGDRFIDFDGIRPDAVFGSQWKMCNYFITSNTFIGPENGIGLVDYICEIEEKRPNPWKAVPVKGYGGTVKRYVYEDMDVPSMYPEKMFITAGRMNGKSLLAKRLLNSVYGMTYGRCGTRSTDDDFKINRLGKWYSDEDVKVIKAMEQFSSDLKRFAQEKIYKELTKGENNMNNVVNALAMNKNVCLDINGRKVPVYIDGVECHSEWGSTETTFKGRLLTLDDVINRRVDAIKNKPNTKIPGIKTVHFSGPVTVVIWEDKTKTLVRCNNENVDYEKGLAMAIAKKVFGTDKSGSNYYDIFKKWLPKDEESESVEEVEEVTPVAEEVTETPAPKKRKSKKIVEETNG